MGFTTGEVNGWTRIIYYFRRIKKKKMVKLSFEFTSLTQVYTCVIRFISVPLGTTNIQVTIKGY